MLLAARVCVCGGAAARDGDVGNDSAAAAATAAKTAAAEKL